MDNELIQDIDHVNEEDKPVEKKKRLKRGDEFYVSNTDLLPLIREYRLQYLEWDAKVENGEECTRPSMTNELGAMLSKIAHRTVYHPKFIKFPSIREEMVSDAIMDMMKYGHNFDPDAETRSGYPNPFGYFTQYCMNAYIQRIKEEKREFLIKAKWVQSEHMQEQIEEIFVDGESTGEGVADAVRMFYNVELPVKEPKVNDDVEIVEPEPMGLELFF